MKLFCLISLLISTAIIASEKPTSIRDENPYEFETERCKVRLATSWDYTTAFNHFRSDDIGRFQFGTELSKAELAEVAASWKTKLGLLLACSNYLPSMGRLMLINHKQNEDFIGHCGVSVESHEQILKLLSPDKIYVNLGISMQPAYTDYTQEIRKEMVKRILRNQLYDASGVSVSININDPRNDEDFKQLADEGFTHRGDADFTQGVTWFVPAKPTTMVVYALES